MRIALISLLLTAGAWADDSQIKMQAGSELVIEQYMQKNAIKDLDVVFRCHTNTKNKKTKCFVIDKKTLK